MKFLFLILTLLAAPASAADIQPEREDTISSEMEAYCAVPCTRRSINGHCWSWGRDFCTPFQGTACVARCTRRSINANCMGYGADFCGIYPECVPSCSRRSVSGRCLSWGADQCVSY